MIRKEEIILNEYVDDKFRTKSKFDKINHIYILFFDICHKNGDIFPLEHYAYKQAGLYFKKLKF